MDLQLAGNVAAVGDDGIDGDAEVVGDLFIRHALHQGDDDLFFAVGEGVGVLATGRPEHHVGDVAGDVALLGLLLQTAYGGHEDMILDHGVLTEPHLVLVDVVEGGGELVVVQTVLRQVFDDEEFQFAQSLVGCPVVLGEGLHIVVVGGTPLYERLHVGEERLLLILHVAADLMGILVVEAQDELGQRLALVERLLQLTADIGQLKVEEIGVAGLQVVQQGGDAELLVGLELTVVVGREVDHRQEGIGIYIVVLTRLHDRLIAKTKADAETAQHLQQVVIVADERDHLVVRLIHLLILHTY